jgi:hypothetical protein
MNATRFMLCALRASAFGQRPSAHGTRKAFGAEHPDTAMSRQDITTILQYCGDLTKHDSRLFRRCLERRGGFGADGQRHEPYHDHFERIQ